MPEQPKQPKTYNCYDKGGEACACRSSLNPCDCKNELEKDPEIKEMINQGKGNIIKLMSETPVIIECEKCKTEFPLKPVEGVQSCPGCGATLNLEFTAEAVEVPED